MKKSIKRTLPLIVAAALVSTAIPPVASQAHAAAEIRVAINAGTVTFPDQKPIMNNNRVLIPTRFVAESLGGNVSYVSSTKTVTIKQGSKTIVLKAGNSNVTVDGRTVKLDVPARIVNKRVMVPLRFVSEAMGANVDWQQQNNLVAITTGSNIPTPTQPPFDSSSNFQFDPEFSSIAKTLFSSMTEANGEVTFTLPKGATANYYPGNGGLIKLTSGKKYTYKVGKGNGSVIISYVDPTKVKPDAPKQKETYVIFFDASRYIVKNGTNNYSTDKAIVVSNVVVNNRIVDKIGTIDEVKKLAQNL
ncbi:copper amine oxidase N-terminal domain-containing protein [Paenibacillus shenyangensis]|uniref:copper amine oxidase N-terminal domain-containing protein n=1 Tax=Paenibacillus sp. A9 TaxID=1284352 RepID=UPI00036AB086|nr:copper amine oxidase N-terminal domain-containing protein [Paenibacillus sp. A9]